MERKEVEGVELRRKIEEFGRGKDERRQVGIRESIK